MKPNIDKRDHGRAPTLRWVLIGIMFIFNFVMISLLWGDRWLPRNIGVAIVVVTFILWIISGYFLFNYLGLTVRGKIAGWIVFLTFFGYAAVRRFSSYNFYHGYWLISLAWDVIGLFAIIGSIWISSWISRRGDARKNDGTRFTVESEAPDHVICIDRHPHN